MMKPTPWPKWLMHDYPIEECVFENIYCGDDNDFVKLRKLQGAYLKLLQEYKKEKGA